jgi:hypothetical protein
MFSSAQSYDWDCGFACAEMVLRALGMPSHQCSLDRLRQLLPSTSVTSIWTVDLAYVLNKCGARFRFLTTTVSVDPTAYEAEPFYKPTLDSDAKRVNDLFARAKSEKIAIEHRSLSDSELIQLLKPKGDKSSSSSASSSSMTQSPSSSPPSSASTSPRSTMSALSPSRFGYAPGSASSAASSSASAASAAAQPQSSPAKPQPPAHIVVALCDRRYLYPTGVVENVLNYCLAPGYVGHYIVLVGYDAVSDSFKLLDPARPSTEPLLVPSATLNTARTSHGTDEDLIVIPLSQPQPSGPPSGGRHSPTRGKVAAAA